MSDFPRGGVLHRLAQVEKAIERVDGLCDAAEKKVDRLDEQVMGARGLSAAVTELADQVQSLRRAAWGLAAIIVTASIGFAFGVLALIGQ